MQGLLTEGNELLAIFAVSQYTARIAEPIPQRERKNPESYLVNNEPMSK